MPFGSNGLGVKVNTTGNVVSALFSESQSRFILTVKKEHQSEFEKVTSAVCIGEVTEQPTLQIIHDGETIIDTPIETLENGLEGSYSMLAELKGLNEECGVFGIWGHPDAAQITYYGLHALQHRGQEGTGIAITDGESVKGC